MRTLEVTSPLVTGEDVRKAQRALKKNEFGSFYGGKIDGQYGEISGNATKDAKFWLGYESAKCTSAYGQSLHRVLIDEAELTDAQKARRKERKAKPPASRQRQKMLEIAITQIGISESPAGSNRCKFSGWYGMVGPWCAMFVTWCGTNAGLTAFSRSSRWAYCPYMVSDALAGRNGLRARGSQERPQPGDIVLFDWGRQGGRSRRHLREGHERLLHRHRRQYELSGTTRTAVRSCAASATARPFASSAIRPDDP